MENGTDPAEFFERHRAAVERAALSGGVAVVQHIQSLPSFGERLILYTLTRQAMMAARRAAGGLDAAVVVAEAGIDEVDERLPAAADEGSRRYLLRALHMLNFNLAADLADCWPGDEAPRERRHFVRGLAAAEALLSPLFDGAVMPHVLANDHWVKGMHLLSLGDPPGAGRSWAHAVEAAAEAARRLGQAQRGPDPAMQVLLMSGYRAIAMRLNEDEAVKAAGAALFEQSLGELTARTGHWAVADEADFFKAQLEKVWLKYGDDAMESAGER